MNKAIFLDRDGTLNEHVFREGKFLSPRNCKDFRILDGVLEAMNILRKNNYALIVISNQPDVSRGLMSEGELECMSRKLRNLVPLDQIYYCFHDELDGCDCRKPKPGLILSAAVQHDIDLSESYMIGDRVSDVLAANAAGCKGILLSKTEYVACDGVFENLGSAVEWITNEQ